MPEPVAGTPVAEQPGNSSPGMNHLGYRGWNGALEPSWRRWMVIAAVGVRRAWTSSWLKRMLFFSWLPAVWFSVGFFIWEQAALYPDWRNLATGILRGMSSHPQYEVVMQSLRSGDLESTRHIVWSWLLMSLFRYPQVVLMVLVVGMIAPPLISQDIRSRAFLIYFSRPLNRGEYVLGKLASLWTFLTIISTGPALMLYLLGILLSPSLDVIAATWDLPLRIMAASAVLMLPTSMLALCFSSMTTESRFAGFAWFVVWILGWFTYVAATAATAFNAMNGQDPGRGGPPFGPNGPPVLPPNSPWTHLSLYHTLGRVQSWIFGFTEFDDVVVPILILSSITLISWVVLLKRISAPMNV